MKRKALLNLALIIVPLLGAGAGVLWWMSGGK